MHRDSMMATFEYRTKKINFNSAKELESEINGLGASEIISIKRCAPDRTDFKTWVEVYYIVQIW